MAAYAEMSRAREGLRCWGAGTAGLVKAMARRLRRLKRVPNQPLQEALLVEVRWRAQLPCWAISFCGSRSAGA